MSDPDEVFVSYKRENLAAVGRLVEALRAEAIGVWWDQDIAPNAAWEATIEERLEVAKVVIVAWSPAAVASENVKAEARWARQQGRLLQVFVEACEPPLFFGERQGVDLKHWSGAASDAAFGAVLDPPPPAARGVRPMYRPMYTTIPTTNPKTQRPPTAPLVLPHQLCIPTHPSAQHSMSSIHPPLPPRPPHHVATTLPPAATGGVAPASPMSSSLRRGPPRNRPTKSPWRCARLGLACVVVSSHSSSQRTARSLSGRRRPACPADQAVHRRAAVRKPLRRP